MGSRYNLHNLKRALADPMLFHNEIRRINRILNNQLYSDAYTETLDVIKKDWDNLIIFDGCRYSLFQEHSDMSGSLSPGISQGAHSNEFMKNTFWGRELHDTVYVTSNPWSEEIDDDVFSSQKRHIRMK